MRQPARGREPLAAQSHVALDRDAGDGRRTLIRLTDQGAAFIRDVLPMSAAAYRRLADTIGTERMRHRMDMLGETLELLNGGERDRPHGGEGSPDRS